MVLELKVENETVAYHSKVQDLLRMIKDFRNTKVILKDKKTHETIREYKNALSVESDFREKEFDTFDTFGNGIIIYI